MTIEGPQVIPPDDAVEDEAEALMREARGRARKRRARIAVLAVVTVAVAAGIYLLIGAAQLAGPSDPSRQLAAVEEVPSPSTFVLATAHGSGYQLGIYSAKTGLIVRRLGQFPSRTFTDNGLALSPNGRAVYYTLIPKRRARSQPFVLQLMRLDVASRRSRFVAYGSQPALNQAGTEIAYGAFPRGLTVRDLRTGETRTIGLGELDSASNLMAANIGWLGDGTDIAVTPAGTGWDLVGKQPNFRWCGTSQRKSVIVFVHVPPAPAPLSATCVHTPGLKFVGGHPAPDPTSPSSVLVAVPGLHGATLVERISQRGANQKVASIPDSLAIAFDANGRHLLYLAGHSPPALTEATITSGRPVKARWSDRRLGLAAGAW